MKKRYEPDTLEYYMAITCLKVALDGVGVGQSKGYKLTGLTTDTQQIGDWEIAFKRLK